MIKTNWRAVLVGCVLLVPLCLWLFQSQQASTGEELYVDMEQVQSVQQETVVKEIVVHVAGAVVLVLVRPLLWQQLQRIWGF